METYRRLRDAGTFDRPVVPASRRIDTTHLDARAATDRVLADSPL